jgi:hypothetical protein
MIHAARSLISAERALAMLHLIDDARRDAGALDVPDRQILDDPGLARTAADAAERASPRSIDCSTLSATTSPMMLVAHAALPRNSS